MILLFFVIFPSVVVSIWCLVLKFYVSVSTVVLPSRYYTVLSMQRIARNMYSAVLLLVGTTPTE